jgi:hypothetical protein
VYVQEKVAALGGTKNGPKSMFMLQVHETLHFTGNIIAKLHFVV